MYRARSRIPTQTLATPSSRSRYSNIQVSAQSVWHIPPSFYHIETDILGEGSFGTCAKAYMQGIEVCLKQLKCAEVHSKSLLREATILSKFNHSAICFLHGVQCEQKPYCLVMNLYTVDGFSVTIYDFLCLHTEVEDSSPKQQLVQSLHSEMCSSTWFRIMNDVAEGLHYIHCKHKIIHRDLKSNIVFYQHAKCLKPVIIDFSKSACVDNAVKYKLTEDEKKRYRDIHKHIAPDLVDGISIPSPSSDMYSYGRIFKNIVCYTHLEITLLPTSVQALIKRCLKYLSTERPTAMYAKDILSEILQQHMHDCT